MLEFRVYKTEGPAGPAGRRHRLQLPRHPGLLQHLPHQLSATVLCSVSPGAQEGLRLLHTAFQVSDWDRIRELHKTCSVEHFFGPT